MFDRKTIPNELQIVEDRESIRRIYAGDESVADKLYGVLAKNCKKSLKHFCKTRDISIENVLGYEIEDIYNDAFTTFYINVREGVLRSDNLTAQISTYLYKIGTNHIETLRRTEMRRRSKSIDILDDMGLTPVASTSNINNIELSGDKIDLYATAEDLNLKDNTNRRYDKPIVNRLHIPKEAILPEKEYELEEWKTTVQETVNNLPEPCASILHDQFLYREECGEYAKDNDTLADEYGIQHIKMTKHRCMEKAHRIFQKMKGLMEVIKDLNIVTLSNRKDSESKESRKKTYRYTKPIDDDDIAGFFKTLI